MLRKRNEQKKVFLDKCHNGVGQIKVCELIASGDSDLGIQFMHYDLLEPNTSIGEHTHIDDEELYYAVCGRGKIILDGEESDFVEGDISLVKPGQSHGIKNTSNKALSLIVASFKPSSR